jgi:hypothetical protein
MIIIQFLSLSTASRCFLSGAEVSGMSSGYFLSQALLCDNYVHTLEDSTAIGRHGGSVVACLTVVLQSRVRIRRLPSPQLTANLLVGCHLGWHLAAG